LQPGDHVIVHSPCYQSLRDVAAALGCQVSLWTAREEAGWALDIDELKRLLRDNTRAVVLNTPHNPTGWLMPRDAFEELVRITGERGVILFSDEVYRGLEENPGEQLPAACDLGPHAVSLGVLSKSYGLPGLRIGWVATRERRLLERMAAIKDYTTICNSAPSEFLATLALRRGEALLARTRAILAANRARADAFFERHGDRFRWVRPAAGPIGFPRLLVGGAEESCPRLGRRLFRAARGRLPLGAAGPRPHRVPAPAGRQRGGVLPGPGARGRRAALPGDGLRRQHPALPPRPRPGRFPPGHGSAGRGPC